MPPKLKKRNSSAPKAASKAAKASSKNNPRSSVSSKVSSVGGGEPPPKGAAASSSSAKHPPPAVGFDDDPFDDDAFGGFPTGNSASAASPSAGAGAPAAEMQMKKMKSSPPGSPAKKLALGESMHVKHLKQLEKAAAEFREVYDKVWEEDKQEANNNFKTVDKLATAARQVKMASWQFGVVEREVVGESSGAGGVKGGMELSGGAVSSSAALVASPPLGGSPPEEDEDEEDVVMDDELDDLLADDEPVKKSKKSKKGVAAKASSKAAKASSKAAKGAKASSKASAAAKASAKGVKKDKLPGKQPMKKETLLPAEGESDLDKSPMSSSPDENIDKKTGPVIPPASSEEAEMLSKIMVPLLPVIHRCIKLGQDKRLSAKASEIPSQIAKNYAVFPLRVMAIYLELLTVKYLPSNLPIDDINRSMIAASKQVGEIHLCAGYRYCVCFRARKHPAIRGILCGAMLGGYSDMCIGYRSRRPLYRRRWPLWFALIVLCC